MNDHTQITSKSDLQDWLSYEKKRYPSFSTLAYLLQASEYAIIWKHQVLLRKTEYHINAKHGIRSIIMRFRLQKVQNRYAIHIPPNVCARGLKLMHLGPVLMNGHSRVGENCIFHINTALVAGGTNDGVPTLGNDVVVGIGAIVLGNTYIADGVAIGANAVVNRDVLEKNIGVAGVPAKKISNNGRFTWNRQKHSQG